MATRIPSGRYCTVAEYARLEEITVQAVYSAIWSGRLKAYKIDNVYIIPADAVRENRRLTTGRFIGINRFRKDFDIEALARSRGLRLVPIEQEDDNQ